MAEDKNKETEEPIVDHTESQQGEDTIQDNAENAEVKKEQEDYKDKYLRLYAEFENFRKRTNKEKLDLISTANAGIMKDLLPVIDDFERAIKNNESVDDVNSIKEGFNLIFHKFSQILSSKGLISMESEGVSFDSELHEAIANIPAPSEDQKGKVVDVVEKGYYLNEKVVRYAKVVVGQ